MSLSVQGSQSLQNFPKPHESFTFNLKFYTFRLKLYTFRLKFYTFRLKV